jgi:hypothetical protein
MAGVVVSVYLYLTVWFLHTITHTKAMFAAPPPSQKPMHKYPQPCYSVTIICHGLK